MLKRVKLPFTKDLEIEFIFRDTRYPIVIYDSEGYGRIT